MSMLAESRAGSRAGSAHSATRLPSVPGAMFSASGTKEGMRMEREWKEGSAAESVGSAGSMGDPLQQKTPSRAPSRAGSAASAAELERAPSHVSAYLGSKNHPEEENELFRFRAMIRILHSPEQHNQKLLDALRILLGMSAVESSLDKMVERGTLSGVFHMLQHFKDIADLFTLEDLPHTPSDHSNSHPSIHHHTPPHGGREHLTEVIQEKHLHDVHMRGQTKRLPLFPSYYQSVQTQPFFSNLDDGPLRKLARPPSFVTPLSDSDPDSQPPSPLLMVSPRPGSGKVSKRELADRAADRAEMPAKLSKEPSQQESQQHRPSLGVAGAAAPAAATLPSLGSREGTRNRLNQKPEKPKHPPPPPVQVLLLSLKIIFNLSRLDESHLHIAHGNHLRFLTVLLSPRWPTEVASCFAFAEFFIFALDCRERSTALLNPSEERYTVVCR
jgi:hypothetical protein